MTDNVNDSETSPVRIDTGNGIATVFRDSPLAKLNFFDGRYLRADDLTREQRYHEVRGELLALAGGAGPVFGLGVPLPAQTGGPLGVTRGLGYTERGETVLLAGPVSFDLPALIAATQTLAQAETTATGGAGFGDCALAEAPAAETTSATMPVYLITIAPVPAFCGREDVYGQLCEAACVQGSAANLVISGSILRARPVNLVLPPVAGSTDLHLRSRLATAWFRRETATRGGLIPDGGTARSGWCATADIGTAQEIPLALALLRNGAWVALDQWAVRRERMTPAPLGFWQGRLGMRRHEVFLAEVLQFQCQLSDILAGIIPAPPAATPPNCADLIAQLDLTDEQRAALEKLLEGISSGSGPAPGTTGWLFEKGIVELPPAGFLPVDPSGTTSLRDQIAALLGPLPEFRMMAAPADVIPHAFEEARDMRRIPLVADLLQGGETRPQLEIFIPDATTRQIQITDYRATHAALHADIWPVMSAALGMPGDQISAFGLFDNQGNGTPQHPSVIHFRPGGAEARLALIGAPLQRGRAISDPGMLRDVVASAAGSAGVYRTAIRDGTETLLREGPAVGVVGLTATASGDLPGGDRMVSQIDWKIVVRTNSENVRWQARIEARLELARHQDKVESAYPDHKVDAYRGQIELSSRYQLRLGGRDMSGDHKRALTGARLWSIADPATGARLICLLAPLWSDEELDQAVAQGWPLGIALGFLHSADGVGMHHLQLMPNTDISEVDFVQMMEKELGTPSGITHRDDRSVAGTAFEDLLASLARSDAAMASQIRTDFRTELAGGTEAFPTRDWVMFRRARKVTEIVAATPVPQPDPDPVPPRDPEPEPDVTDTLLAGGFWLQSDYLIKAITSARAAGESDLSAVLLRDAQLLSGGLQFDAGAPRGVPLATGGLSKIGTYLRDSPWNANDGDPVLYVFATPRVTAGPLNLRLADRYAEQIRQVLITSGRRLTRHPGLIPAPADLLAPDDLLFMLARGF